MGKPQRLFFAGMSSMTGFAAESRGPRDVRFLPLIATEDRHRGKSHVQEIDTASACPGRDNSIHCKNWSPMLMLDRLVMQVEYGQARPPKPGNQYGYHPFWKI